MRYTGCKPKICRGMLNNTPEIKFNASKSKISKTIKHTRQTDPLKTLCPQNNTKHQACEDKASIIRKKMYIAKRNSFSFTKEYLPRTVNVLHTKYTHTHTIYFPFLTHHHFFLRQSHFSFKSYSFPLPLIHIHILHEKKILRKKIIYLPLLTRFGWGWWKIPLRFLLILVLEMKKWHFVQKKLMILRL